MGVNCNLIPSVEPQSGEEIRRTKLAFQDCHCSKATKILASDGKPTPFPEVLQEM